MILPIQELQSEPGPYQKGNWPRTASAAHASELQGDQPRPRDAAFQLARFRQGLIDQLRIG